MVSSNKKHSKLAKKTKNTFNSKYVSQTSNNHLFTTTVKFVTKFEYTISTLIKKNYRSLNMIQPPIIVN